LGLQQAGEGRGANVRHSIDDLVHAISVANACGGAREVEEWRVFHLDAVHLTDVPALLPDLILSPLAQREQYLVTSGVQIL